MITAVRLRLLPAPAGGAAAGGLPARPRGGLCGDLGGARGRPAPVGARLPRRRDAVAARPLLPGARGPPAAKRRPARRALRADRGGGRHARGGTRPSGGSCSRRSTGAWSRWTSRPTRAPVALARRGQRRAVTAVRGAKVSEDVVFPRRAARRGTRALRADRRTPTACARCSCGHAGDGNVHATVLVDPAAGAGARRGGGRRGGAVRARRWSSAARSPGEHGVGWSKRGRLESQWPRRAVELHEQIKGAFDPKGLLNPGKKLARYPARSPLHKARKEGR